MEYEQEINNCIDNNVLPVGDIYDFRGTAYEKPLSDYYYFCRENLNIQASTEKISPNILIFTNSFEVNAGAGIKNKNFVIAINLGLFKSCVSNYLNNDGLVEYFQNHFPNTILRFDNPVNTLAFQICTQFSYYHELAHLFQLSGKETDITIGERIDPENKNDFDLTRHILEINADTYASIAVTTHIEQYIEKVFKQEVTFQNTAETFIFFGCCLLNYTINFSDKPEEVYFKKYKHPHSFIRQLNTVIHIVHHLGQSPYFKKAGIVIKSSDLFLPIIDVYKELEANGVFKTNVTGILDKNKELHEPMSKYLFSLLQFDTPDYKNAMDIWNKGVK